MDILDEKFAITAFIAELGIQSKDLMFSISKKPQASMAEVLAKSEKYRNDEEALDLIVDATTSHELLSFMDTFLGYNQIRMEPNDQEKTSL